MIDSEDDDYELPSLAERIQGIMTSKTVKSVPTNDISDTLQSTPCSQVIGNSVIFSESENEESEFLKFSERIRNTPCSEVKVKFTDSSEGENEESEFLKFSEKIRNTPCSAVKFKLNLSSSGSESEDSEFLKFSERIRNTPRSECKQHYKETPDSPTVFKKTPRQSNSSDNVRKNLTSSEDTSYTVPQAENKKEYASLFPTRCDDSLFYRKRAFYTQTLYEFFNRKIFNNQLPKDMPLIWDGSLIKTAGLTYCKVHKGVFSCSIKLSSKLLTTFDRLQDTLLHEMCHAAVWVINKRNIGHGPLWQLWASRCKMILPFIDCPERCHTYDVPYRFWYECTGCKWRRGTCRRSKKYHGAVCKRCNIPIVLTVNR